MWGQEGHPGVTLKASSPVPQCFLGLLAARCPPHPHQTDAARQNPRQEHPVWNTQFTLPSGEWTPEEEEPGVQQNEAKTALLGAAGSKPEER